jgi:hypothetical protein
MPPASAGETAPACGQPIPRRSASRPGDGAPFNSTASYRLPSCPPPSCLSCTRRCRWAPRCSVVRRRRWRRTRPPRPRQSWARAGALGDLRAGDAAGSQIMPRVYGFSTLGSFGQIVTLSPPSSRHQLPWPDPGPGLPHRETAVLLVLARTACRSFSRRRGLGQRGDLCFPAQRPRLPPSVSAIDGFADQPDGRLLLEVRGRRKALWARPCCISSRPPRWPSAAAPGPSHAAAG